MKGLGFYAKMMIVILVEEDNDSIPAIWQGAVCKLVMSCPLTGLPSPDPSPIDHSWDNLGWWKHDRIPSQLPHFPNWNTSWLNNDNAFHKVWSTTQGFF